MERDMTEEVRWVKITYNLLMRWLEISSPMGMLYAPIVKHESIVEWWDLPISKKTIVEWGPA